MKKIQNYFSFISILKSKYNHKLVLFIISVLVILLSYISIDTFLLNKVDRNTYVELLSWEWKVNNNPIFISDKLIVNSWDKVSTIWDESILVISWWDWSLTRLWWNSEIIINDTYVSDDKTEILLSFELLSWKSWSNVISFLWEWSYFKQYFNDNEASVRWTIFNVDLDNNYLYVIDHNVNLKTNNWEEFVVPEKKPLNLLNFSFIKLEEFIQNLKDKSFDEFNRLKDKEYYESIKSSIISELSNYKSSINKSIESLSLEDKKALYDEILSKYQDLNIVSISDWDELFNLKLELKENLIKYSSVENKSLLSNSLVYDFKDSISSIDIDKFKWLLNIVEKYDLKLDLNNELFDKLNSFINTYDIKSDFINFFNKVKDSTLEFTPF